MTQTTHPLKRLPSRLLNRLPNLLLNLLLNLLRNRLLNLLLNRLLSRVLFNENPGFHPHTLCLLWHQTHPLQIS